MRSWEEEVRSIARALGVEHAPDEGPTEPGPLQDMLIAILKLQHHSRLWTESQE